MARRGGTGRGGARREEITKKEVGKGYLLGLKVEQKGRKGSVREERSEGCTGSPSPDPVE